MIPVRKFIEFTHRLGARLSFNKIPELPPGAPGTTGDEGSELAAFLRDVLRRWEERDARRIVVFAKGVTLRRLLREVSHTVNALKVAQGLGKLFISQLLGSCIAVFIKVLSTEMHWV